MEYKIGELENRKMQSLREAKTLMADTAAFRSIQKVENHNALSSGLVFPDRTRVIYIKSKRDVPQHASFGGKQTVSPEVKDY